MIFKHFKKGSVERVYINDLDCLEGTNEKAYIKPLPKSKRKGDAGEVGVELIVSNEDIRPYIESALRQYGLMPEGTVKDNCFSIYKNIADKHRFTGGSLIKGGAPEKQNGLEADGVEKRSDNIDKLNGGDILKPESIEEDFSNEDMGGEKISSETTHNGYLGKIIDVAEAVERALRANRTPEDLPKALIKKELRNAKYKEHWIQDFSEFRNSGGTLEEVLEASGAGLPFGLELYMSNPDPIARARLAMVYNISAETLSRGRCEMICSHNEVLHNLGPYFDWKEGERNDNSSTPRVSPPAYLSELRLVLYCLYSKYNILPADECIDYITLYTYAQITNRSPIAKESGVAEQKDIDLVAFRITRDGISAALHEPPAQPTWIDDHPLIEKQLEAAFKSKFSQPSPIDPCDFIPGRW